eukprot:3396022-Pyramimonas_sp.AAC.1
MDQSAGSPSYEFSASTKDGARLGAVDAAVHACHYPQELGCASIFAANAAVSFLPPADPSRQRLSGPCPGARDARGT